MNRVLRAEAGDTLIEVLLAVIIIGIAAAALFGGLTTAVITSTTHRAQATANTYLVSAADAVKNQIDNPYGPCASTGDYNPDAGFTKPNGFSASITQIRWWNGTSFGTTCSITTDKKLQLVTVRVVSTDGRANESTSFIKRNPA